ncbi:MAG: NfeD family protein [Acidimicrobiales bacterium]
MRRLTSVGVLFVALALVLGAAPVHAQTGDDGDPAPEDDPATEDDDPGFITVIEVNGLIDDILVDFVSSSIDDAEDSGARYLVIHLDSPGAVVSDGALVDLARQIHDAEVPVASWIGPSGAQALGGAAQLAAVTDPIGVSIGARIGRTGEPVLPEDEFGPLFGDATASLVDDTVGHERVLELDIAPEQALTLGQFALTLPGFESIEVIQDGEPSLEPSTVVRFSQLDLPAQIFHTVASPEVTYLLLVIGLALLVFELYTAGVGIAGLVGAGSLVLASYGLWVLPVRPIALVLVLVAFVGFAVDVQTGVPRFWTAVGGLLFAIGSLTFYDAASISWITLVVAFVGVVLTFLAGMPAMVRTRFSTPTIGREWMIGEGGLARGTVDPDGVVVVRDAPWRAHTNRATPIADGDPVRVVAIEGMVLQVEPEDHPARDHRDR